MEKIERWLFPAIFGLAVGFTIGAGAMRYQQCVESGGQATECIGRAFNG